ncbi:hypothetical protein [Sphaerisporangium sp. TRM90804]|uniref:hypothetical protein n=1 Tax=Sphaerisporangium sp. TRM90804 TaxID=3031113 RepID=UPI00244982F1|nr:hypothetical protein [Sphaerisporangium sp. TRM90804]MDH2425780.1 hypothetical protein [Sphaerisporangium sp. TRM90804]
MNGGRILRGRAATLTHTFLMDEETPGESSTPVTVAITDAGGHPVASGTATGAGGRYSFPVAAQAQLTHLTAAWSATIGGQPVLEADLVEVVGGFFFDLGVARASDASLADTGKYPSADLAISRQEVEEECERICQRAFVPRYRRVILGGSGTPDLLLPDGGDEYVAGMLLRGVRTVRSASVAPRIGQTFVPLTVGQLAACAVTVDGLLRRTDGGVWTEGICNVLLEYEYGSDAPPADLRRASLLRLRSRANIHRSGVPDRAISFTVAEGGTYRLSTPSASRTGVPEVDAVYDRYSRGPRGTGDQDGSTPASRSLNFDPQRGSLFHGGER